jgi:branched-chain amino acid transport system permease protein
VSAAIAAQLLIAGLSTGSIYAFVALGLVLIFKGTGVVNFAQGEFLTMGAYIGLFLSVLLKLPYWQIFILTLLLSALIGAAIERALIRPLMQAPAFTIVVATLAIGLMIKSALRLGWQESVSTIPSPFGDEPLRFWGVNLNRQYLWVVGCSVIVMTLLVLFFRLTLLGKAMRAVSQNQEAARLMGIRVSRVFTGTFAISAAIAGLAGLLIAPVVGIQADMGDVVLKGFVAAILGGFQSIGGAVVGGFLLGLLETFGGAYFGAGFAQTAAFGLLLIILVIRPHGLLGQPEARRV